MFLRLLRADLCSPFLSERSSIGRMFNNDKKVCMTFYFRCQKSLIYILWFFPRPSRCLHVSEIILEVNIKQRCSWQQTHHRNIGKESNHFNKNLSTLRQVILWSQISIVHFRYYWYILFVLYFVFCTYFCLCIVPHSSTRFRLKRKRIKIWFIFRGPCTVLQCSYKC